MNWLQIVVTVFGLIIGNGAIVIPLFLWIRAEGNADRREFKAEMKDLRIDMNNELKDFHGRLCAIEERKKEVRWKMKEKYKFNL